MKRITKFLMLAVITMAVVSPFGAKAQTNSLLVANGTVSNEYIPIYGYYADAFQHSQMVYPASMLTTMQNNYITQLEWYMSSTADDSWGVTVTVSLAIVSDSVIGSDLLNPTLSPVWTGIVNGTTSLITIPFSVPFYYSGGNLLVDVKLTGVNDYSEAEFYGISRPGASMLLYDYDGLPTSTSTASDYEAVAFLPKTSFSYVAGGDFCVPPVAVSIDSLASDYVRLTWVGDAASYGVQWGETADFVPGIGATTYSTGTTFSLSSLTAGTCYTVLVWNECTNSNSDTVVFTFCTPGEQISSFPYTTGFEEDDGDDVAWSFNNGTATNKWYIGTAANNTIDGSHSLYISSDNGVSNNYNNSSTSTSYAYRSLLLSETGDYEFSFDWRADAEECCDYLNAYLVPGSVDMTSANLTTSGWTQLGGNLNESNTWTNQSNLITIITPGTYYLVFRWTNDYSDGDNPAAAVDNIRVSLLSCSQPTALTVDSVNTTEAVLNWTPGGDETSWSLSINGGAWQDVTMRPYTVTGLNPGTYYIFQIRGVCGIDDSSLVTTAAAWTECVPIVTLPYTQDFEGMPTGQNSPFNPCWSKGTNSSSVLPYVSNYTGEAGYNHVLYTYCYNTNYCYAVMPELDASIDLSTLELGFDIRNSGVNSSDGAHMIVAVIDTNAWGTNTPYDTIAVIDETSATFVHRYVSFADYTGMGRRIAFLFFNQGTTYNYVQLDNIDLHLLSNCAMPTNLTLDHATSDSLVIVWSDDVNSSAPYWVEYRQAGVADTTPWTGIVANDTTVALGELSANTIYNIKVRTVCLSGDSSNVLAGSFRTSCGLISALPWTENFDNIGSSLPCWKHLGGGTVSTTSSYYHNSGNGCVFNTDNSTTGSVLLLPEFEEPIENLQLSFWSRPEGTNSGSIGVGYVTDTTDATTFVELANFPVSYWTNGNSVNTWLNIVQSFGGAPSDARMAFRHNMGSSMWYWFIDDIVVQAAPECIPPTAVNITGTTCQSIGVSVFGQSGATYRFTISQGANIIDSADIADTFYTFQGLTAMTQYVVGASVICYDGSLSQAVSVSAQTTVCGDELPYLTGFETGDDDSWSFANGTQSNKWVIGNATGNGGGKSMYISNNNGASNAYNVNSTSAVYAYKAFDFTPGQYSLSYDWICQGEDVSDYLRVFLAPGNVYLSAGVTNGISDEGAPTGWIAVDGGERLNQSNVWQTATSVFTVIDTTTYYVVFYWYNDFSDGTQPPAAVDNILISSLDCPAPANLVVDSINASTAYLHWTPMGDENQWSVSVNGGAWQNVNTSSFVATGLTPNTNCTFAVRANCGYGDTSFAVSVTAYTDCLPISVLPYTQNFDALATGVNAAFDPCWSKGTNAMSAYPYVVSYTTVPGYNNVLYSYCSSNNYCYAIMPAVDNTIPLNTLEMSFDMRRSSTVASNGGHLVVAALDANTWALGQPFDTIAVFDETSYTFVTKYVSFATYTGTAQRIAFLFFNDGTSANIVDIDNIDLHLLPSCLRPNVPVVTYVGHDQIGISFSGSTTGDYRLYITDGVSTDSVNIVDDSTYLFTGLTPLTTYTISIASDCGTELSPLQTIVVTTTMVATALPYSTGFEVSQDTAWLFLNDDNGWYVGSATNNGGSNALYISDNGGTTNSYVGNTSYSMAYKTFNFSTPGDYVVSFDWKANGESTWDYLRVFLVPGSYEFLSSNANGISDAGTPAGWIALDGGSRLNLNSSWQNRSQMVSIASAANYYMLFYWHNDGSYQYNPPAAIDNVQIAMAVCPSPSDIVFDTIGTSYATFHWVPGGSETMWLVDINGNSSVVNIPSYTATGLTSTTSYTVSVRSICGVGDTGFATIAHFNTALCGNMVAVLTGNPDSTTLEDYTSPINNYYNYGMTETIIDAGEIGGSMDINAISFYYNGTDTSTAKNNVTIYLQPTTKSVFANEEDLEVLSSNAVMVYSGNLNCSTGWNNFGFTTPYSYNGIGNLMVIVVDSSGNYDGDEYTFLINTCAGHKTLIYYSDDDLPNPYVSLPGTDTYTDYLNSRVVMRLVSCGGGCVEPVINTATASDVNISITWLAEHDSCYVAITDASWDESVQGTLVAGGQAAYTFSGLTPATQYIVGVRQRCSADEMSNWTLRQMTTSDVPCIPVENITISDIATGGATVSWTAVGAETAWNVRVYNTLFDETYRSTSTTYVVEGLTAGVTYNVNVQPLCGSGANVEGPWADNPVSFTTEVCHPVTDVAVVNVTGNAATVSWTAAPGTSTWRIEYGESGFSHGEQAGAVTVTENPYTITGLTANMVYDVYVATVCDGGLLSTWSQTTTFETSGEGIDDIDSFGTLAVHPNPASSMVTVEWSESNGTCHVDVVDLNGRTVISQVTNDNKVMFDAGTLAKGAYFVRITGGQNTVIRKLIVK